LEIQPFASIPAPDPSDCVTQLYERAERQALQAESPPHQRILRAANHPCRHAPRRPLLTAHKEGGSHIHWDCTHYCRYEYGESNDIQTFPDDPAFLASLPEFYRHQLNLDAIPSPLPEFDAWKLILRLMQYK
jgi:hypothetical protein